MLGSFARLPKREFPPALQYGAVVFEKNHG